MINFNVTDCKSVQFGQDCRRKDCSMFSFDAYKIKSEYFGFRIKLELFHRCYMFTFYDFRSCNDID